MNCSLRLKRSLRVSIQQHVCVSCERHTTGTTSHLGIYPTTKWCYFKNSRYRWWFVQFHWLGSTHDLKYPVSFSIQIVPFIWLQKQADKSPRVCLSPRESFGLVSLLSLPTCSWYFKYFDGRRRAKTVIPFSFCSCLQWQDTSEKEMAFFVLCGCKSSRL